MARIQVDMKAHIIPIAFGLSSIYVRSIMTRYIYLLLEFNPRNKEGISNTAVLLNPEARPKKQRETRS